MDPKDVFKIGHFLNWKLFSRLLKVRALAQAKFRSNLQLSSKVTNRAELGRRKWLSHGQCDQIGRIFATLATFYESLSNG